MKTLIPMLFVVMILATGCPQPEPEVRQTEIGLFTPYMFMPEIVFGNIKEIVEINYMGVEEDGKWIKGERLTVAARDTIAWTNDFRLTYDETGNLTESVLLDENDQVIDKTLLTVEEGKIVKAEYITKDTVRNYMLLTYNEASQLVKVDQFRMPADTLAWSTNMLVDDQGHFLEWQSNNYKGDPGNKYIFTVNLEGRRTGYTQYNKEGEKVHEEQFTYNEMGFLQKQVMISKEGEQTVSEYEYEYDAQNNWIKVLGNSDTYMIITERSITYYE
jgi:hypothetical protein